MSEVSYSISMYVGSPASATFAPFLARNTAWKVIGNGHVQFCVWHIRQIYQFACCTTSKWKKRCWRNREPLYLLLLPQISLRCASYHYVSGRHCAQYFLGGASNSINVGKPPDVTARNLFLPNNVVDHIGFARRSLRVWSFFECLCFENLSVGDGLYFQVSTYIVPIQ